MRGSTNLDCAATLCSNVDCGAMSAFGRRMGTDLVYAGIRWRLVDGPYFDNQALKRTV